MRVVSGIAVLVACVYVLNTYTSALLRMPIFCGNRSNETFELENKFDCGDSGTNFGCFSHKESTWIENMKSHLSHTNFYLNFLKRELEQLSNVTSEIVDKKEYLGDPYSLFSLLKRMVRDWAPVLHSLTGRNPSLSRLHSQHKSILADIANLETGYRGLARLQQVYNVSTAALADHVTPGGGYTFSAQESFEMAKHNYMELFSEKCQKWLEKTQEKIKNSFYIDISEEDILELSFMCKCDNGDGPGSKTALQKLLETNPSFTPLMNVDMALFYGCERIKEIDDERIKVKQKELNIDQKKTKYSRFIAWKNIHHRHPHLLDLCRYPAVYVETARLLKCRYVHYNKPQLMIGPFKMEEFHIDPPVLMFHDVISDAEIATMANYGEKLMYKATIHLKNGSDIVDVQSRTNEQCWARERHLPLASVLSRRAAMFTNWDLYLAEPNQIARYGPAGEFVPHIDSLAEEAVKHSPYYADYSVVMFYISEVTAGGHTIFPYLNVSLVPQKGSAAIWFNRKPDGSVDSESLHGGCPVLRGYKWVINTWFHRHSQEFPKCTKKKEASFRYFYL